MVILLAALACDEGVTIDASEEAAMVLTRASLDLRGARPSVEDLDAVRDDPGQLDGLIADYLAAEGFGDRVAALYAPVYGTRATDFDIADASFAIADEPRFLVGLGEEPLRVLAHVAEQDLPLPELFVGDWTVIDEHLAEWYPADYPEDAAGWQVARFTDGRPSAGVLSTSGLWWRYQSTASNVQRGRANAISRIFLCRDYLVQPIVFDADLDLSDEDAVADAIRTHDGCVTCHHSLDPLGAYLWGFQLGEAWSPVDISWYNHVWEIDGPARTGVDPAYYGDPGYNLTDLGAQMAADPATVECAVSRSFELLLGRPLTLDDQPALTRHREAFIEGGLTYRALFASILADPAWRDVDRPKVVTDAQLVDQLSALTGFRFVSEGYDVYRFDRFGLRSLVSGGGLYNAAGSGGVTPMMMLVRERLIQASAMYAAEHDRQNPEDARLFTLISFTETPLSHPDEMDAQVTRLYQAALGRDPQGTERADALALWGDAFALAGDTERAWAAVLELILRHPDFLVY
ncbi:MAG: hypothetical protein H6739_01340 [Alphaproteobacteria bacterium]|nr:hypothetical protein [Alphaproteobacteria bacterium]